MFRVKAGSLQQLLKSSTVDFLLNSTEISAKFVHFVIVIFLEDTSLHLDERPLTEEQAANNRASWDSIKLTQSQSSLKTQPRARGPQCEQRLQAECKNNCAQCNIEMRNYFPVIGVHPFLAAVSGITRNQYQEP